MHDQTMVAARDAAWMLGVVDDLYVASSREEALGEALAGVQRRIGVRDVFLAVAEKRSPADPPKLKVLATAPNTDLARPTLFALNWAGPAQFAPNWIQLLPLYSRIDGPGSARLTLRFEWVFLEPDPAECANAGVLIATLPPESPERMWVLGLGGPVARQTEVRGALSLLLPALLRFAARRPGTQVSLPPRLERVLERLVAGDSAKQAAVALGLSVHTIRDYLKDLHRRLGVSSRAELVLQAIAQRKATPRREAAREAG